MHIAVQVNKGTYVCVKRRKERRQFPGTGSFAIRFFFFGGGGRGAGEQRDTYVFKAYRRNGRASRWYKIFSVIKHQIFSIRVRFFNE